MANADQGEDGAVPRSDEKVQLQARTSSPPSFDIWQQVMPWSARGYYVRDIRGRSWTGGIVKSRTPPADATDAESRCSGQGATGEQGFGRAGRRANVGPPCSAKDQSANIHSRPHLSSDALDLLLIQLLVHHHQPGTMRLHPTIPPNPPRPPWPPMRPRQHWTCCTEMGQNAECLGCAMRNGRGGWGWLQLLHLVPPQRPKGQAPPLLTWPRYHLSPIVTDGESLTAERGRESFAGDKTEPISALLLP